MQREPKTAALPTISREKRNEIKRELLARAEKQKSKPRRAFAQKRRTRDPIPARLIAYDLETTRIQKGTPRPLYITAYGDAGAFVIESPIRTMAQFAALLRTQFLTDDNRGVKFVAWNGNRFDAYFIAAALLGDSDYLIVPYLTRSHAVRGLRVSLVTDGPKTKAWEFLDGIAMLGLEGVTLDKLLKNFAPDFLKHTGAIDFETEQFDPKNPWHREYALRDSEGLYHAMVNAQSIMLEHFEQPLGVTMGGACIKIFQANIPAGVEVKPLDPSAETTFRQFVMRGGFCYCARRYSGPVWKYDLNQAYAAAMRESEMPCGPVAYCPTGVHSSAKIYVARVTARNPDNRTPFYYRTEINGRIRSQFATTEIFDTWLTSVEIEQLRNEGWSVSARESYVWSQGFTMRDFVDRLERLRTTCEGGPSGPIGTMTKATGNHSYGKTVEELASIEFALSIAQPKARPGDSGSDFQPYFGDDSNPVDNVWFRFIDDPKDKDYHAVQIGAFITASVRMKVRRAALIRPDSWLYADTDCVIFDSDVTKHLDIDPKRYGAWKIEESGTPYLIIAKKVYAEHGDKPGKRSAKGLNVKRLTGDDFSQWYAGTVPVQTQTQRNNFLVVMQGAEMFREQVRKGTRVETVTKG